MMSMQEVNVRVAVRVRPLLAKETLAGELTCVKVIPKSNQIVLGKDRAFTFDHAVTSKTAQEEVYKQCVDPLVQSCFEGYNATVFAYGQTGSGKTYTVGGGNVASQSEEEFGILPRAISHIFDKIKVNHNREYTVKVSYIEIYKEELQDLLDTEISSKDLHIREDDKGNTLIVGATELQCQSVDDVMACLEQGAIYRHTGSTAMNEHSSRSHSIFTMLIEQAWVDGDLGIVTKTVVRNGEESEIIEEVAEISHYMCAKFHFVDLAGSERAHRTGNVGDRFKESIHINSGLLALGNVISALGDTSKKKVTHIPYRDSKITRLLKDSLGGNANTLMICCISPATSSFDESLNALKYANRARNIKNKPIVNRDPQSIRFEEMQSEIKALREELHRQRTSVVMATTINADHDIKKAIHEVGQIKELEERTSRLQTECSHYRTIAEEAYKQLQEIQGRDILSRSMNIRLSDWLELMEEIKNKVPSTLSKDALETQIVTKLQTELRQCRNDLKSDEEIFAEKAREVSQLNDRIAELEHMLEESQQELEVLQERVQQQEEQLVSQQVTLEDIATKLKEREKPEEDLETTTGELEVLSDGPPTTTRRAKSVPASMLGNRNTLAEPVPARNIHTSPALFSLERVMASFRARSQLLLGRLEDADDVLQQAFSDDSGDEGKLTTQNTGSTTTNSSKPHKQSFQRNTKSRGTYKVSKPKVRAALEQKIPTVTVERDGGNRTSQTDDEKWRQVADQDTNDFTAKHSRIAVQGRRGNEPPNILNVSQLHSANSETQKEIMHAEMEMRMSTQKARDISINIRLKEQLIKELVKTGKEAQAMNHQYEEKITSLEKDKITTKQELANLQKAMHDLEHREYKDKIEKERLQLEFRKKMELAKTRLNALTRKQKDTERLATITGANNKRIQDLEGALTKMRQQQEQLQRKLKDEMERKAKLEREMAREQQRVRELETRNAQQKKVLKVKTEEMALVQRRLRSGSHTASRLSSTASFKFHSDEQSRLDGQRKWIDSEIEKVLDQRRQVEELEKDLSRREDIIAKKEAMLDEKSELEMKKLRSSQVISKDIKTVSMKLESVERRIQEKTQEAVGTPREQQGVLKDELKVLQVGRDKLKKQRDILDGRLKDGSILSTQEERRLIELDEAVEALDAAMEYKNDAIHSRKEELRHSTILRQSEDNLLAKLSSLSAVETRTLLSRYFEKVIELRELERKRNFVCSNLEMKVDEQDRLIIDLESSLGRAGIETDRRLTQQQQQYERKIQALMRQLADVNLHNSTTTSLTASIDKEKLSKLEKDLYYYKHTSRELKKKIRELLSNNTTTGSNDTDKELDGLLMPTPRDLSREAASPKPVTPRPHSSRQKEMGDLTARGGGDRLSLLRDAVATPVRISRRDLRRMSDEEVTLRKSALRESEVPPQDSLEVSQNPGT